MYTGAVMKLIRMQVLVEDDVIYFMETDYWHQFRNHMLWVRVGLGAPGVLETTGGWRWEEAMDRINGRVRPERLTVSGLRE